MRDTKTVQGLYTAWGLAVLAHLFWGLLGPGGKILLEWWPTWTMNALRMAVATVIVMLFYGRDETRYGLKALLVDKHLIVLGVVGIGMTFGLYIASLRYIEATAAAVMIFLAPYLTALLARVVLKESIGWPLFLAASLALVGAYLALFGTSLAGFDLRGTAIGFGLALNFASVLLWAVYTVHLKVVSARYPVGRLTVASFMAATVFFALSALVFDVATVDWEAALRPVPLGWLALYAVVPSAAAYLLYASSIGRVGAGPITILLGLELLVTALLAHFLLGERFPPVRIVGLVLTTAAVVWFVWMRLRRERAIDRQSAAEPSR